MPVSTEEKAIETVREATKRIREEQALKMGIVKCPTFKCLGILSEDGTWRDARDRPLEVIEVVAQF